MTERSIFEFGHTAEELEKVVDDDCWDYPVEEFDLIAVNNGWAGMVYWIVDGRIWETVLRFDPDKVEIGKTPYRKARRKI